MNPSKSLRAALAAVTATALLAMSAPAFAQNTAPMLKYVPTGMDMVMGADIAASRSTTAFKEMLRFIKAQPEGRRAFRNFTKETGLKLDKDVDQVIVATDKVRGRGNPKKLILIVTGNFDANAILNQIKSRDKNTKELKVAGKRFLGDPDGDAIVGFLDKRTLYLAGGSKKFVKTAKKLVAGKGANVTKDKRVAGWMKNIDVNRHMWFVADTSRLKAQGPKTKLAFGDVDLTSGFGVRTLLTMAKAADAKKIVDAIESRRTSLGLSLMMFGARPLLSNLKMNASGAKLDMSTSMTGPQVKSMLKLLREAAEQQRIAAKKAREERRAAKAAEKAKKEAAAEEKAAVVKEEAPSK